MKSQAKTSVRPLQSRLIRYEVISSAETLGHTPKQPYLTPGTESALKCFPPSLSKNHKTKSICFKRIWDSLLLLLASEAHVSAASPGEKVKSPALKQPFSHQWGAVVAQVTAKVVVLLPLKPLSCWHDTCGEGGSETDDDPRRWLEFTRAHVGLSDWNGWGGVHLPGEQGLTDEGRQQRKYLQGGDGRICFHRWKLFQKRNFHSTDLWIEPVTWSRVCSLVS